MTNQIRVERHLIFPTPVLSVECATDAALVKEAKALALAERAKNPESETRSNRNGWQSHSALKSDPAWAGVADFLLDRAKAALSGDIVSPDFRFTLENLWINISGRGAYNLMHTHPGAAFAGVYYLQASTDSGNIVFQPPSAHMLEITMYTPRFMSESNAFGMYWFEPSPGRMLLFPASLQHYVEPNLNDEERISLSFNIGARNC